MKIFSQIRYVLFAMMAVGIFANFAQNEYGLDLFFHCCALVGLTLLIESVIYLINKNKNSASLTFYLFTESLLLGVLNISFEMKNQHWIYSNAIMVFTTLFITLFYLSAAFRYLIKDFKYGKRAAFAVFLIFINTILAICFSPFKMLHWPGVVYILWTSFIITVCQLIYFLFKIKFNFKGKKITLGKLMNSIPGKLKLAYVYFTIWIVQTALVVWGVAPGLYIMNISPAVQKMNDEGNPKARVYGYNYGVFIDNRQKAEESK